MRRSPLIGLGKPTGFAEVRRRLHTGNIEALAAADVLAGHFVIQQDHVTLPLLEFRPVALVSARWQAILLLPHQPAQLVLLGGLAERTLQASGLVRRTFVVVGALVHQRFSIGTQGMPSGFPLYSARG